MSVPYSDRDGSEAPKSLEGNEPETTFDPSGSPSNPSDSSDALRRVTKYRAAIMAASLRAEISGQDESELAAKAAIEVADKEQARLRAEVENLRTTTAEDLRYIRKLEALLNGAEGWRSRAVAAEHKLERVREAIDIQDRAYAWMQYLGYTIDDITEAEQWEMPIDSEEGDPRPDVVRHLDEAAEFAREYASVIDAILDADAPEASEECAHDPQLSRSVCGQCGDQEAWCSKCAAQLCQCADA